MRGNSDIIKLIDQYIDKGDFDSAYTVFLKNINKFSYKEREDIRYTFPPKYFKELKNLSIPYYERIDYELEKGDPAIAYRIYLENVKHNRKRKILFLNQCLSAARRCTNIVRRAKIETILKKILPEHQKHVNDVGPDMSMGYGDFCKKLDKLYASYDINNYDARTLKVRKGIYDLDKVKELIIAEKFGDVRELFLEIERRGYNSILPLDSEEITLFNMKRKEVLATRTRIVESLKKRTAEYCLKMFELERYGEIKKYYAGLVKTGFFYNAQDAVISMERTLLTLIDGILRPLLGNKVVDVNNIIQYVFSSRLAENMLNEGLVSELSLREYLTNIVLRHNDNIRTYIREAKEEQSRLLEEEREKRRMSEEESRAKRSICDLRARDIRRHGVKFLYHFTKLANVRSILQNGILPREMLDELNIVYAGNDDGRYDGRLDTTSVSLSFPNWQMFYSLRAQDKSCKWAVIEITVGMLDENTFECYSRNAAMQSGEFRVYKGYEMFGDSQDEFPEDPQAELLVEGKIDPKYITKIYVNDSESKRMLDGVLKPVEINGYFFNKRRKDL